MKERISSTHIQQFRSASREYSDASAFMHEAIARKAGLSSADHKYLGIILQQKEMTAGALAKLTGLTTGAVTSVIDRLEKKKLVSRKYAEGDRRKVIIAAHEQNAMKLMAPLFKELQQKTEKLLKSFEAKELEIIERYFKGATGVMKEVTEKLNQ